MGCHWRAQVITAHDECLMRVLRFSLIERLRPLTAIGTINRACSHFCDAIDKAVARCRSADATASSGGSNGWLPGASASGGAAAGAPLTKEQLLAIAADSHFRRAVDECDAAFTKVRRMCSHAHHASCKQHGVLTSWHGGLLWSSAATCARESIAPVLTLSLNTICKTRQG